MPIYVYKCCDCGYGFEEFQHMSEAPLKICPKCKFVGSLDKVPTLPHTDIKEFNKPIHMHSIGLAHPDEIADFQRRNPEATISTDERDPLYGVPIAHTRKEKLDILKTEGFIETK
jgi:putative FmdB family regulatory protein